MKKELPLRGIKKSVKKDINISVRTLFPFRADTNIRFLYKAFSVLVEVDIRL